MSVLPAYAGMILQVEDALPDLLGAPRVCGDDPDRNVVYSFLEKCSPRMRG